VSAPVVIDCRHHVDAQDQICPGCHEPVSCQPPANYTGQRIPQFAHRDGSPLCWYQGGSAEPIERESYGQPGEPIAPGRAGRSRA
jgi:hypothetical protein